MTNVQLWLSIGIPSFLVVLSWLSNNARFAQMDSRFERIERHLDAHDRRFDEVISNGHKESLEIMRSMTALLERIAVVQTKQAS